MEEIRNREEELTENIGRIDEDSKSILIKDGVGQEMLEKMKNFFSKFPILFSSSDKKSKEL